MDLLLKLVLVSCITFCAAESVLRNRNLDWHQRQRPRPPPPVKPSISDATNLDHKGNAEKKEGLSVTSYPLPSPYTSAPPQILPKKTPLIDATNLDHKQTNTEKNEEALKRKQSQFDLQTPAWRLPWPRHPAVLVTEAFTEVVTTEQPIVLYKRDCDACLPGYGVKSMCDATSNTICEQCPLGTWSPTSPHYRQCTPCSKCGRGMFEAAGCVVYRDTYCDQCSNPKATINEDYLKKCNWRQSARTVNPREMDLDDTRFDVEVIDWQSKEMTQLDGSPEFGSNEEDLDRFLLLSPSQQGEHEEDIVVDDPEIDLEEPQGQKEEKREDESSKEDWARITAMRQKAKDEIAELSRRLAAADQRARQQEEDTDDDDDDDDDVERGPRPFLLQPIRPMPQMVPVPRRVDIDDQEEEDMVRPREENNYPPSYHSYPIDALVHAGQGQRRKAIVLLVLTCAVVLSTIIFVVCYVKEYCRRRGATYNRVLVVNLSPEEQEIVRQSAHVLESMEQSPKKHRGISYAAVEDDTDEQHASIYVTENPLEAYLNATDERHVAKEGLLENEVLDPRVHRHA